MPDRLTKTMRWVLLLVCFAAMLPVIFAVLYTVFPDTLRPTEEALDAALEDARTLHRELDAHHHRNLRYPDTLKPFTHLPDYDRDIVAAPNNAVWHGWEYAPIQNNNGYRLRYHIGQTKNRITYETTPTRPGRMQHIDPTGKKTTINFP